MQRLFNCSAHSHCTDGYYSYCMGVHYESYIYSVWLSGWTLNFWLKDIRNFVPCCHRKRQQPLDTRHMTHHLCPEICQCESAETCHWMLEGVLNLCSLLASLKARNALVLFCKWNIDCVDANDKFCSPCHPRFLNMAQERCLNWHLS